MGSACFEALVAIDRLVVFGHERDCRLCAALSANSRMPFPFAACALTLTRRSASLASYGLILEALLRVKLLLARCEHELRATVLANKYLVLEHLIKIPLVYFISHDSG